MHVPIGSMGRLYLPTFTIQNQEKCTPFRPFLTGPNPPRSKVLSLQPKQRAPFGFQVSPLHSTTPPWIPNSLRALKSALAKACGLRPRRAFDQRPRGRGRDVPRLTGPVTRRFANAN